MNKFLVLFILVMIVSLAKAGGISVDAGLTPAQDRWIIRSQFRYMSMYGEGMNMQNINMPFLIAYGVTPDLTLMLRNNYLWKGVNGNMPKDGINDPYLLAKVKLLRINKPGYSIGVAPALGSNLPIGSSNVSSRVWSPEVVLNASYRPLYWAFDLNIKYRFNNLTDQWVNNASYTDELNFALSRQLYLRQESSFAIVPVLEYGLSRSVSDHRQSVKITQGIAPGLQVIFPTIVFEGLYQTFYQSGASVQKQFIFGIKLFI